MTLKICRSSAKYSAVVGLLPSMFEPIHGSAPKYGGLNKANPIGTILAGKLMLENLGEEAAAALVEQATEDVLGAGRIRTYDMGGTSSCSDMGDAISERLLNPKL